MSICFATCASGLPLKLGVLGQQLLPRRFFTGLPRDIISVSLFQPSKSLLSSLQFNRLYSVVGRGHSLQLTKNHWRMSSDSPSPSLLHRRVQLPSSQSQSPETRAHTPSTRSYSSRPGSNGSNNSSRYIFFLSIGLIVSGLAYYATRPPEPAAVTTHPTLSDEDAMALAHVNKRLREKESVTVVNAGSIVARYESNNIPSNEPYEDRQDEKRSIGGNRFYFGMYDGHGGWECVEIIKSYLTAYVAFEVEKAVGPELPLDANLTWAERHQRREKIDKAITIAFQRLDADILNGSLILPGLENAGLRDQMRSSFAGSCALLAFLDGKDLYVACTGDARAVLGRKTKSGYETLPLSQDQTPRNPEELRRMMQEHPGEEYTVVVNGRVLGGLMPTRAFGDSRYKYSLDIMSKLMGTATARGLPRNYLTPPYVTATPAIVHHELDSSDKFLILATDGLWDELESEEAVEMVADLVESRKTPPSVTSPDNYIKLDTNAATHLIRNGFGGSDHERIRQLLALRAPISRRYRDDVTTTVVFFDNDVLAGTAKKEEKAVGEMMVVDPKKGGPKEKQARMPTWIKMAEMERNKAKL